MISLAFSIAMVSQDAIFGAIVSVGALLIAGTGALVYRSFANAGALDDIKEELITCNLSKMKSQVDELWMDRRETWRYLQQRGDAEALNTGVAKRNSPLKLDGPRADEIMTLYDPYIGEIAAIYDEVHPGDDPDESHLFEAVAKRLGTRLLAEVCPIIKADRGGCVSLAIASMKRRLAIA